MDDRRRNATREGPRVAQPSALLGAALSEGIASGQPAAGPENRLVK